MSILALFLLLGVASSKHISYHDDHAAGEPIEYRPQKQRICAALCTSNLGGEPCGCDSWTVTPQIQPPSDQSNNGSSSSSSTTGPIGRPRTAVCPTLCNNFLGNPLCNCDDVQPPSASFIVDFHAVCRAFCVLYNAPIDGCHSCNVYVKKNRLMQNAHKPLKEKMTNDKDMNQWCIQMCKVNLGGAACSCDFLPMSFK